MQIHNHEQRTPEWYAARIGIPTASMFTSLVTPTGKPSTQYIGYACTLANELYAHESELDGFQGNSWTGRGEVMEDEAAKWYQLVYGVEPEPIGFVTETGEGWEAGCSPDRFIGDIGMLEIKCLKAENHTKALREYSKSGATPSEFKIQTQGQMLITSRGWCDLLLYHDKLPKLVIKQTPDADLVQTIKNQLSVVCAERDATLTALRKHAGE